ncbi:hypothetical protein ILUMI_02081 [Ignelater luminosus]|uniref:Peptidase S1 domain-containing protein n=1 Tax=Ignelater luminosus TaxID=2038154 RepID=A0A8K0GLN2_IGNLU|nr:hypothetical protein ILUMI_02081 [Ignelater luminosus]
MILKFLLYSFFTIIGISCQTHENRVAFNLRTTIDYWRFVVSILVRGDLIKVEYEWEFHCGGVIITSTYALTTGWCIKKLIDEEIPIHDMIVRGNTETWNCSCGRKRDHTIQGFVMHENFKESASPFSPTVYTNDIGIISVIDEFNGLYEVPSSYRMGTMFWTSQKLESVVVGWGYESKTAKGISDRLHYGTVKLYDRQECESRFRGVLPPHVYCIMLHQTPNVCTYESGGLHTGFINQYNILIGLISSGIRCDSVLPTLITNISEFTNWVKGRMKENDNMWPIR